jgi:uncharacterized protein (DUF302 family)
MTVRKIEIERLTITSSKPFETVVAALEAAIGRPDMAEFMRATRSATTYAELQSVVQRSVSAAGLMLFMKLDAGAVIRKESGLASPKAQRFLIGNPLIMKEMAKYVPEAASYAPVTVQCGGAGRGARAGCQDREADAGCSGGLNSVAGSRSTGRIFE